MNQDLARKLRYLALALGSVALAANLVACGGGGGSSTPTAGAGVGKLTALYFTDDFSAENDAVWITVRRVVVVSPAGETQVAAFDPGQLVNLPTLRRSGALVALASIPAGATSVRVYVGSAAQLQRLDGSLLNVTLQAPSGYLEFRLEGWNADSGALALDFDLPKFALQGNVLLPSTRIASNEDFAGWNQRYAEAEGLVTAVTNTSVTLSTNHYGTRTFVLDANTTFVSKSSATWRPLVGEKVEIYSAVAGQGADALQFTARSVKDGTKRAGDVAVSSEIEGMVTAKSGSVVTVNVAKSKTPDLTGSVSVDIGQAQFKRGSEALLVPGVRVEAYLTQQGTSWVATAVEIEGAAKTDDGHYSSNQLGYAELKGNVASFSGNTVVVNAVYTERLPGVTVGSQLSLDLSGAYFEKGAASCLLAGTPIELKGAVDAAGTFRPVRVEMEGGCAIASPVAGVTQPAPSGTNTGPIFVEAKGTVSAVRSGELDLSIYSMEHGSANLTVVTVQFGATTVFKGTSSTALRVGNFVEVKGNLNGTRLTASKIELD